jgi:hypothetical protein
MVFTTTYPRDPITGYDHYRIVWRLNGEKIEKQESKKKNKKSFSYFIQSSIPKMIESADEGR